MGDDDAEGADVRACFVGLVGASTSDKAPLCRKAAINGDVNTKRALSMKGNEIGSDVPVEPEDLFEMVNLYPSTTGLPMTLCVSPRGNAHHDVRVRVNITNGGQIDADNTAVVVVRPTPRVTAGKVSPAGAQAVMRGSR